MPLEEAAALLKVMQTWTMGCQTPFARFWRNATKKVSEELLGRKCRHKVRRHLREGREVLAKCSAEMVDLSRMG
jgi:hypothetical protein